jgi:ABC-type siderophore export system fused ATPase/permease subunit
MRIDRDGDVHGAVALEVKPVQAGALVYTVKCRLEAITMGYEAYEAGGLMKVLGALVILIGVGLAGYLLYLSRSYWVAAVIVFLVLLVLGSVMVSRGGYTRKQNTPIGRVDDVQGK